MRKEGHTQGEIDHLFNGVVLSKILHGISLHCAKVLKNVIRGATRQFLLIFFSFRASDRRLFNKFNYKNHWLQADYIVYFQGIRKQMQHITPSMDTERVSDSIAFLID